MFFVENEKSTECGRRPNDQFSDLGRLAGAKCRKKTQAPTTHPVTAEMRPAFRAGGNWFKSFDTFKQPRQVKNQDATPICDPQYPTLCEQETYGGSKAGRDWRRCRRRDEEAHSAAQRAPP